MQMKPKKDRVERMAHTAWAVLWGLWGLVTAIDIALLLLHIPGLGNFGTLSWACMLAPLHLACLGFLTVRRYYQDRDD